LRTMSKSASPLCRSPPVQSQRYWHPVHALMHPNIGTAV